MSASRHCTHVTGPGTTCHLVDGTGRLHAVRAPPVQTCTLLRGESWMRRASLVAVVIVALGQVVRPDLLLRRVHPVDAPVGLVIGVEALPLPVVVQLVGLLLHLVELPVVLRIRVLRVRGPDPPE